MGILIVAGLTLFGWEEVGMRLRQLVREGRWGEMPALLSDEMLDVFVPSGHYEEIFDLLEEEFGDFADSILISLPEDPAEDRVVARTLERLHGA